MTDETRNRSPGGLSDTSTDAEILAYWFTDLARAYELVAGRARECAALVRSDGIPACVEEGAALKRLAAAICALQHVVFAPLDGGSKKEETLP